MKKINKDSFPYQLVKINYITAGSLGVLHALDSSIAAPIFNSSVVQNRHWAVGLGLTGTYIAAQGYAFFKLARMMNDAVDDLVDDWNEYVDSEERIKNLSETER